MPIHPLRPTELDPIERASRDEIAALQLARLRATLDNVYANVPHYRRAFDDKGVHPSDLKTLADLFPGRTVVGIHALDLVWGLGTLHCLTQQQPAPKGTSS